ncbi:efflux RND transporter periplasmic adaptor subunit [Rhizobium sp. 2MFCol3.1]|uniref:efflux RND transporter periplasmic adaptor subunit n=1 Tax=Rhizobium sp. 2MFCol3.1 TaxID=1246459 RepID=UPI0003749EB1|nr:efflux RND transporter periplasmic adaptor subunit [Rhizobium sp. 2MFCol3.1]
MNISYRMAILSACVSLASCNAKDEAAPQPPRPVLTMKVASAFDDGPGFAGTVEARYQTARGFQVLGRIESLDVEVGDWIEKGQRLAALDPTSFQLDVNSKIGDTARAEARLKNAASTLDRTRRLVSSGASTQAKLEADIQALAAAQAALDQSNAELAKARTRVDYTTLNAGEDGVVVSKDADVGQTVNPGQTVVTIARTDAREVVVDVAPELAASLGAQEAFDIVLQADPSVTARGRVREIAPQADAATRTRRVKIALEAPPEPFRLGATVTAKLSNPPRTAAAMRIPRSAVMDADGGASVWVVDPQQQTVRATAVTIQQSTDNEMQISNGLSSGQIIVVAGVSDLKDGQKIQFDGADAK